MLKTKSREEIELIAQGGKILAGILFEVVLAVRPGVSTFHLSELADKLIIRAGGRPAFKNFQGFPSALCTSINDVVVHGVPSKNDILKDGDIIGLDIGMQYPAKGGLYTDMARTVGVGDISPEAGDIIRVAEESFDIAMSIIRADIKTGDIGEAVQRYVESEGYSVVRSLSGHGVGYEVHEEPTIPNFGKKGTGTVLPAGSVIAIEPMVCEGDYDISVRADGWSAYSSDGKLTAHHENTLVVEKDGPRILTVL